MACLQATCVGSEIVIECDPNWSCCQREQAKDKVKAQNKILGPNGQAVRSTAQMKALADDKQSCCAAARKPYQGKSAKDQAALAKAAGASDCLVDEMEKGTSQFDDLQMDHSLEVKLGGPAKATLVPLDRKVNGAFGNIARNVGDEMGPGNKVTSMSLVCPASAPGCPPPPSDGHSEGKTTAFPANPSFVTPKR